MTGPETSAAEAAMLNAARIEGRAQQFSTYIEMTEALTDRQATVIRYYIALHTAMIAAGGGVFVSAFDNGAPSVFLYVFLILICFTGLLLCRLWGNALTALQYWESLKYKIIREVEEQEADFAELYAREWRMHLDHAPSKAKRMAKRRAVGLPRVFARFYWAVALIVAIAIALRIDAYFGGVILAKLDAVLPGAAELLSNPPEAATPAETGLEPL